MPEEKNIQYYAERLNFVLAEVSGKPDLLDGHKEEIRELVKGYSQFKRDPQYNLLLSAAVETLLGCYEDNITSGERGRW